MEQRAAQWMHDDETQTCLTCAHHCRRCGGIFCDDCSHAKHLIHPAEVVYPPDWDSVMSSFDPREPLRVCNAMLRRTTSNAAQRTEVDRDTMERYMNVPIQFEMSSEIVKATHTLLNFCHDNALEGQDTVPRDLIAGAYGLAFITTMQAGFFFSARVGTGLVISRTADGGWSAPSAVCTTGAGWGLQIGGEVTDMLIVLNSQDAVDAFASTAQLSLGTELSLALGPLGRSAETNMTAGDNGASAVFSYAHSKGFFIGIALQACVILARPDCNERFYGENYDVATLLSGVIDRPAAADPLYRALEEVIQGHESAWVENQHKTYAEKTTSDVDNIFQDNTADPFAAAQDRERKKKSSYGGGARSSAGAPHHENIFAIEDQGTIPLRATVLNPVEQEQIDADLALALALSEEESQHAAAIDAAASYAQPSFGQEQLPPARSRPPPPPFSTQQSMSSSWFGLSEPPPPVIDEDDDWAADRRRRLQESHNDYDHLTEELHHVRLDPSRRPHPTDATHYTEEDSAILDR